jgi:hypothetical protein
VQAWKKIANMNIPRPEDVPDTFVPTETVADFLRRKIEEQFGKK